MKFEIEASKKVWFNIEVEADSEEEALEKAEEMAQMRGFCGNGVTGYLVGITPPDEGKISLEPCEGELEDVEVKEVDAS